MIKLHAAPIAVTSSPLRRHARVSHILLQQLAVYGLASIFGLVVDSLMLLALVEVCGLPVLLSAALSFTSGALAVHAIAIRFVFSSRQLRDKRLELAAFVVLGLGGLLVTLVIMWLGTHWVHLDYRLSKAIAAGCSFMTNFVLRKSLLF